MDALIDSLASRSANSGSRAQTNSLYDKLAESVGINAFRFDYEKRQTGA